MVKSTLFSHFFKNVPFNIYNTPQICSGMLKIAPKALHFRKFLGGGGHNPPSVPSLRRLTPFIIPQKIILATFIVSLLCIGFTNIVDCFIIIFNYLKEIRSIIIKNIFQNILNKKVTKKIMK